MKVIVDRRPALSLTTDAVIVGVTEAPPKEEALPRNLAAEDKLLGGAVRRAQQAGEFKGARREMTVFHRTDRAGRIILLGLGARPLTAEAIRDAVGDAVQRLKEKGIRSMAVRLDTFVADGVGAEAAVRAVGIGAILGSYSFTRYRSNPSKGIEEAIIALGEAYGREEAKLRLILEAERPVLDSVLWTRDVANVPPNEATPEWLAEQAVRMGKEFGLKVTVFDETKLKEMNCGGILAVGGGSTRPPRMVVLEYPGKGKRGRTIAIAGKGITFDSGGINLKTGEGMADMKFDKCGACAVLGILRAAADLEVAPRVIGVLACAENLPSGSAYRPSDIIRTYSGATVEVLNTDAEGRVVLADALGYVVDKYHPDEVIDLATLTGAAVVAVGENYAPLISTDDRLAGRLLAAGEATGETLWRLPFTSMHREMVKSDVAEVKNVGEPRGGGSILGGAFLAHFVGTTPWAHLDIAGPAWTRKSAARFMPGYQPVGATAFGVRLVTEYLRTAV
ncbi:MAG: leucyl aminopeptidase [Thermoplasmata archaeon]|nr:leucyl aminopeptidase [Thermoplasmata archaeon]